MDPTSSMSAQSITASETDFGTCTYRGSGMAPTVGLLDAERVLQRLTVYKDNATETGRRATPQRIVDIVRNRTLK